MKVEKIINFADSLSTLNFKDFMLHMVCLWVQASDNLSPIYSSHQNKTTIKKRHYGSTFLMFFNT